MTVSIFQRQAAAELLRRRRARVDPIHYAEYIEVPGRPVEEEPEDGEVVIDAPETMLAAHHKMILREVEACFLKDTGRLMIFMPPGSAKSTYGSVVAPSYLMGKYKKTRIGLASYADSLALKMGRRTRSIINQKRYRNAFDTELSNESAAANNFKLTNGSEYMATGILGAFTGNRFEMLVIDDPVKGREQADSETIREKTWDAYKDDLLTRLVPGGSVMVIQCMTGETRVMMADGSEKELRNVRPGDSIATYEGGKLTQSTVRNWANQGSDRVFAIRTKSGKIARANERHPFLVARNGGMEWVRLRDLTVGDAIIQAIANAEHGPALSALPMGATFPPSAKDIACRTITKRVGQADIDPRPSTQFPGATRISSIDTACLSPNTTPCSQSKTEFAPYVSNRPATTCARIGAENCASTIATTQAKCVDCYATTAISQSDTGKPQTSCFAPLHTYTTIPDEIVEIVPDGYEDVFDIQVDRTENFVANGLVSHNTRWHEDDLSGRILPEDWNGESGDIMGRDGNVWRVLCLQAECDTDTDPLGRARGEMLWPEWFTPQHWAQFRGEVRTWGALFQQIPKPKDGLMFKPDKIEIVETLPAGRITWVRGWDLAATEGGGAYTVGGLLGIHQPTGRPIIADIARFQKAPGSRDEHIRNVAVMDGRLIKQDIPDDPGAGGTAQTEYLVKKLKGCSVVWGPESGDKETRAIPLASEVNIGNVMMMRGEWNRAVLEEMRAFPNGTYKDIVDALSRAYARLVPLPGRMSINKQLLQRVRK